MLLFSFSVAISLEIPLSSDTNNYYQDIFSSQDDLVIWAKKTFLKDGISDKERSELLTLISTIPSQRLPKMLKILNQKSDIERINFFKTLLQEQGLYSRQCQIKVPPELTVVGKRKYAKKKKDLDEDEAFRILILREIEKLYQMSKKLR